MGKDFFTVTYDERFYKCYLDAEGELWVIDDKGNSIVIASFKKKPDLNGANDSVLAILKILGW